MPIPACGRLDDSPHVNQSNDQIAFAPLAGWMGALPRPEFHGRARELAAIARLADDAQRGRSGLLAFEAPPGAGAGELLRQGALALASRRPALLPIFISLDPAAPRPALESALLQSLAWLGEADYGRTPPACLPAALRRANLAGAEDALDDNFPDSIEGWRHLWRALRERGLAAALLIEGHPQPHDLPLLRTLLAAARAERRPVLLEAPADPSLRLLDDAEFLALEPLAPDEALALAQSQLEGAGRRFDHQLLSPILTRLGPWPGWVRAYAAGLRRQARDYDLSPARLAEQAYLDFLTESGWSRRLAAALDPIVGAGRLERVPQLVEAAGQSATGLSAARIGTLLGLADDQVMLAAAQLARLGLLRRRGLGWSGPAEPALADWAWLVAAATADGPRASAARMDLLAERLVAVRPAAAPAPDPVELLTLARGQEIPQSLLRLEDFSPNAATGGATLELPELLEPAQWRPAPGAARLVFARGWRAGRCQRSHEVTWIAIDLAHSRSLTTAEIEQAELAATDLERRLGTGHYVRWLIVGGGASPEALALLRERQLFCSGPAQLALLHDALNEGHRATAITAPAARIVGFTGDSVVPGETITLPACPESELGAAQAAERFARQAGFEPAEIGRIKTAVLEGVLNAVEHSADPEKRIELRFILTPRALEVIIDNEGRPFDPLAVPEPDARRKLGEVNKRGWGISLMKRFMDEVGYEPVAGGTRLRLIKRRPVAGPVPVREAVGSHPEIT